MVNYAYGIDIDHSFSFVNGDLKLAKYEDNLNQAIVNRLLTVKDTLDMFYDDYGSLYQSFFGWKKTQKTLDFLKVEINSVLKKDPRINDLKTDLDYDSDGNVKLNIKVYSTDGEITDLNYVLSKDNVNEVSEVDE